MNRAVARKLQQLTEALQYEITSHVTVKYGLRMLPLSIEHLRLKIADALHAAKLLGELHAFDRVDPTPTPENTNDDKTPTNPGFRSRRPPPPPPLKK